MPLQSSWKSSGGSTSLRTSPRFCLSARHCSARHNDGFSAAARVAGSSSCPVYVACELSASFWFWFGGMPPNQNARRGSVSCRFSLELEHRSGGVVVSQTVRPEEDGKRAIGIFVDAHRRFDKMRSQWARWDLQTERSPFDGVVMADLAGLLDAEDLAPSAGGVGNESRAGLLGDGGELRVVGGNVDLGEPAVGQLNPGDSGERQLLRQPILQGAEGPLRAAARLGGVGSDMLDAELGQRPADLGRPALVDLGARLGRVKVVTAAIAIEGTEQAVPRDHFAEPAEGRSAPLLIDQET